MLYNCSSAEESCWSGSRRRTGLDDVQKILEAIRLNRLSSHYAGSFVDDILGICVANHIDVCGKPLLERSSNEEAIGVLSDEGWITAAHLATFPSTDVDETVLDLPDPVGKGTVQEKVDDDGPSGELFCSFEAIFVVQREGDGSNDDSGVSKSELHIGVPVGLAELEAVQVVLQGIVGCVLTVCQDGQIWLK
ncbi:hypothetical protein KCU85_g374, partial [Aureobasidium melanogenum]